MQYLTLKSKVKIGCNICDKCCINRGDIKLTPINIIEISKYMNISIEEFISKYTKALTDEPPEMVIKTTGDKYTCILNNQDTNKCSVHSVKPMQCVMFPLVPVDLEHDIFFNQNTCPYEQNQEIKVIDWLNGKKGIYVKYKKLYIKWINLMETLQKKWSSIPSDTQGEIYKILYYDYDSGKGNIKRMVNNNIKQVYKIIKK